MVLFFAWLVSRAEYIFGKNGINVSITPDAAPLEPDDALWL
jgi:hypothetical protein